LTRPLRLEVVSSNPQSEEPAHDTFTVSIPIGQVYCDTNQRYHGLMLGPTKVRFTVRAKDPAHLGELLNEIFQGLADAAASRLRKSPYGPK
jgi:hypothetical protein